MKQVAFWGLPVTQVTQVTVPRERRTQRIFRFLSWALYRNTVSCVTCVTGSGFAAATPKAKQLPRRSNAFCAHGKTTSR